ncbi:anti-sigma factor antagonist [Nocardioides flavescens]|uniref:Anti-sigma factor antagonist n=1 Tax=Nocardioides flavescens TaxID=2691959 RepID=A0A6L7EYQ6_9ACTN|nr:anti-sigma factor antagonist [Nocardioides flavescens]
MSDIEEFDISVDSTPERDHVQVSGHLDIYTSSRLREALNDSAALTSPVLVIDLLKVAFMDSTGLGALVAARRQAKLRGAELRLVCQRGAAYRVIRITKLDQVLSVFGTLDEALAAPGPA